MSTFPDMLCQFGGSPVGPAASVISAGGKWYWVDPANGNDNNSGTKPTEALLTVSAAEDKCVSGKHDGVFVIGSATAVTETASITWDKSFTHLIGLTPPTHYGIRNRILCSTIDITPVITISGNGCVFQNVMVSQEGDDAHNLYAATITGARNFFGNCTFRVIGATAVTNAGKRDVYLNSSNGENYFSHCTFGSDSYDGSANAANYPMEWAASAESARNVFDHCIWLGSGSSGASFMKVNASATTSMNWFKDCLFYNNDLGSMNAMTQGFSIAGGNGHFVFQNTVVYGATNLETSDSGMILVEPVYAVTSTGKLAAATW